MDVITHPCWDISMLVKGAPGRYIISQEFCIWLAYGSPSLVFGSGFPDSKVHEANMGPTWDLSAPDGPHVGPMNLAIRVCHGTHIRQSYFSGNMNWWYKQNKTSQTKTVSMSYRTCCKSTSKTIEIYDIFVAFFPFLRVCMLYPLSGVIIKTQALFY